MASRRPASFTRDPVAIAALAVLTMLVVTLLVGLLVPIYTDEVAWRMMLARSPLDGGFDRGLGDQCGPNSTVVAPFFMQPIRHFSAWMATHVADPRAVRISGVGLALAWVALFWRLTRRLPHDLRATGRTIGLSLIGLGVLPFLLVWSRPEQPLLIAYTLALMVALAAQGERPRHSSRRAWAAALIVMLTGVVALSYHPKGVVFLPIPLIAAACSSRGREGRGARIAAVTLLIGAGVIAFRYWSLRFGCAADPQLAAALAKENIASTIDAGRLVDSAGRLFSAALPWPYVDQAAPSPDYMSNWLPSVPIPPLVGVIWQLCVRWIWRGAIYLVAAILIAGVVGALARRRFEPRLMLAGAIAFTVLAWGATQLKKNSYESALQLPLIVIMLVLALPMLGDRFRRVVQVCALPLAILSIGSQLLLITFYAPVMTAIAAQPGPIGSQPYSYVPWGYPALEREIAAAARACAIDPVNGRHLLVDDMTYFPLIRSWLPLHRMAHLGVWRGSIGDPIAYLQSQGASGGVTACAYMPDDVRARAKVVGRFCCIGPWPKIAR